jgi:hypothetical protein
VSTSYKANDVVTAGGSTYLALNPSTGVDPTTDTGTAWTLLAAKGADGAKGDTGAAGSFGTKGDKGDKGDSGTPGTDGGAGKDGADGAPGVPGIPGPPGPKGDTGATGPQGPGVGPGSVVGQLLYWNGSAWVTLQPPAINDVVLRYCNGLPQWTNACGQTPPPASGDGPVQWTEIGRASCRERVSTWV